eukprot:2466642-Pyramimonas_sp.AAC.1
MALTFTGNVATFDKIKDVLTIQRGRVYIRQKSKGEFSKGFNAAAWTQRRPSYPNRSNGKGK